MYYVYYVHDASHIYDAPYLYIELHVCLWLLYVLVNVLFVHNLLYPLLCCCSNSATFKLYICYAIVFVFVLTSNSIYLCCALAKLFSLVNCAIMEPVLDVRKTLDWIKANKRHPSAATLLMQIRTQLAKAGGTTLVKNIDTRRHHVQLV